MASLPHITVGGAIATGTHGSGDAIGTLSSAVTGIEIVTAGGHVRWVRRGVDPDFGAWVVSIGALGVVTRVEMEVEPTYEVAQTIFAGLDLDVVEADFDAVFGSATSVSVFTRWRPEPDAQLWLKRRIDREGPWPGGPAFGVPPRDDPLHPLEQLDPVHCNPQRGQVGPGTNACRTSAPNSPPAPAMRSRPNTCCRAHTPSKRFEPCARCTHASLRFSTSLRSALCAATTCG